MQRKYTLAEFDAFIQNVYRKVPQVCIGTDVIVGFPGERDTHFRHTEDYLRESCIHYFHVFSYSARHMARSRTWKDQETASEIIQARSRRLRSLSQRKRRLYHESLLGTEQTVLFEQRKGKYWNGLTDNYVRIQLPSSANLRNELLTVKLERIEGTSVVGSTTVTQ